MIRVRGAPSSRCHDRTRPLSAPVQVLEDAVFDHTQWAYLRRKLAKPVLRAKEDVALRDSARSHPEEKELLADAPEPEANQLPGRTLNLERVLILA